MKRLIFCFFLTAIALSACRVKTEHDWDVNMLTPVAHGEVSISNVLKDSLVKTDSAHLLHFVYVKELKDLGLSNFLKVPDTVISNTVTLKQISLGERTLTRDVTLGEVARNAGVTGQFILFNQGQDVTIPPLSGISTGDVNIDATSFFESATFVDGKLKLEISNGFPIELDNLIFNLRNKTDQAIIVQDTIKTLLPGDHFTRIYSLANKTVEGKMVAKIINMDSPGSNGQKVRIDTSDAIRLQISAYDMNVFTAKAIFPAQNVVDDSVDVGYYLNGAEITFMKIHSGEVRIVAKHTINDSLHLHYVIPYATLYGHVFDVVRTVPPAPAGSSSQVSEVLPVDGYSIDLTGKNHDTVNTFYNRLTLRIDSTGRLETLSLSDSIYFYYGLFNIIPEYAKGYLGQQTLNVGPEHTDFSVFKNLTGSLNLNDVNVTVDINNGVGAEGEMVIEELKGINTRTGQSVALTGSVLSSPITILPATDNPFKPALTSIKLNSSNSNIKNILSILPDRFEYQLQVKTNPKGKTTAALNDFVYYNSDITANLNIDIPANFSSSGISMNDTFDFNPTGTPGLDRVKNATFHINMENTFPLDLGMQLYVLDSKGLIIDSLLAPGQNTIKAGVPDVQNPMNVTPTTTKLLVDLTDLQWQKLISSRKLMLRGRLNTRNADYVKLYSTYALKTNISARFQYQAKL
jgi:hypothetical protein